MIPILIGICVGIATQSPMPVIIGVAVALFFGCMTNQGEGS
jgi:hypothetical protein